MEEIRKLIAELSSNMTDSEFEQKVQEIWNELDKL